MGLAKFISTRTKEIISDWEQFALTCTPAAGTMDLKDRRDHIEGMLAAIAADLRTPQSKGEQTEKSKGTDDAHVDSKSPANSHGTDRAAMGYTPVQMVAEFRALRASILRRWSEAQRAHLASDLEEVTRFNEAIDQLLAESVGTYMKDVEHSKDLFLGVVGHDLRNPLGAIMMSATGMMVEEGAAWPHARKATRILACCTRMEGIISDLMDVTLVRLGGGIPIVQAQMDLGETCRHAADEIAAFHPGCVVTFAAKGELTGEWDSGRIGQLTSNLVGNAFQHGEAGEPIEVTVHGEAQQVELTVRNKGPVIPKSALQDIFSPFRQLEPVLPTRKPRGSVGLGLFIAKAIVTSHGGTLEVASTKRGTAFTARLPRHVKPA